MNHPNQSKYAKRGFTLVEILVVLVIATVVLSIAIPRIRTVNKERNMREAARVIGSTFASASQRAAIDGIAGVRITRNANFLLAGSTQRFAATEISLLRKVPNYLGDQVYEADNTDAFGAPDPLGASKIGGSDTVVEIKIPFERDVAAGRPVVRAGDEISFNNSRIKFQITSVAEVTGDLELTLDVSATAYPKLPENLDDVPYVIYRQPRPLRSSITSLPANYIIDLRYSGFLVLDAGTYVPPGGPTRPIQLTTVFEPAPLDFGVFPPTADQENYNIEFIFDEEGSISRVLYKDLAGNVVTRAPLGPAYFLITETSASAETSQEVATADEHALWVTIGASGTTNIGYNNPNESAGQTINDLSTYYFADDPDGMVNDYTEEDDRDEFNGIISRARDNSTTSSASQ